MKKILISFFALFLITTIACKEEILLPELIQGSNGADGLSTIFAFDVIPPNDVHNNGGVMFNIGYDTNGDLTLNDDEISVSAPIWNGNNGTDGLSGANGVDGSQITIGEDGFWYIDGVNTNTKAVATDGVDGQNGSNGQDGVDGKSPYIENGFWFVWDADNQEYVNSGQQAQGNDGKDGLTPNIAFVNVDVDATPQHPNGGTLVMAVWDKNYDENISDTEIIGMFTVWNGADGSNGADGLTPTIGENGYWYIGNYNTLVKAEGSNGVDGHTPLISIYDGYWYIDGESTGVTAVGVDGQDGENGADGIDGVTPTITISDDGYWVINDVLTDAKAIGTDGIDGQDGVDGKSPKIGQDGYWYVYDDNSQSYINTLVVAKGAKGDKGDKGDVVGYTISTAQDCDGTSGYRVTIQTNPSVYFEVCDGKVGATGAKGEDGEDGQDCVGCSEGCEIYLTCNPYTTTRIFNNDWVALSVDNQNGWTYTDFRNVIGVNGVVSGPLGVFGGIPNGNGGVIQNMTVTTPELFATNIYKIQIKVRTHFSSDKTFKYKPVIVFCDGSEEDMEVKTYSSTTEGTLTWDITDSINEGYHNVSYVRFEVANGSGHGTWRAVINKVKIYGFRLVNN